MKVGVIGTGNMGENHVRTYLSLHEHCEFVGIYDQNQKNGQQIAGKYHVKQFHTLSDLLVEVDAVSVAVPTEFHYDIGLMCIKHQVHMLMEKPITSTVTQAKDLYRRAENAGVKLQIGHIELFNPFIQLLMEEVKDEAIIGIDFQRMSPYDERMKDIDVVNDLMIHDLYILHKLMLGPIAEMHAIGNIIANTPKHAAAIIRSSNGVTAQLTASFKAKRKIRTIHILTENAFIEADILKNELKRSYTAQENISKSDIVVTQCLQIDHSAQPLTIQLFDFLHCIQMNTVPTVTGEDGINALVLTNKISEMICNTHEV